MISIDIFIWINFTAIFRILYQPHQPHTSPMMETVHVKCNNTNHENNPLVHPRRQAQAEHPPARPYQGLIGHCCEAPPKWLRMGNCECHEYKCVLSTYQPLA